MSKKEELATHLDALPEWARIKLQGYAAGVAAVRALGDSRESFLRGFQGGVQDAANLIGRGGVLKRIEVDDATGAMKLVPIDTLPTI